MGKAAEIKTKETESGAEDFINGLKDEQKRPPVPNPARLRHSGGGAFGRAKTDSKPRTFIGLLKDNTTVKNRKTK